MGLDEYTGREPPVPFSPPPISDAHTFEVRPPGVSAQAEPIYDEGENAIVGYVEKGSVTRYFDVNGHLVGMSEPGLESPMIDPIDILVGGAGLLRSFGRGGARILLRRGAVAGAAVATGARMTSRALAANIARPMLATFRGLTLRNLRFTGTAAAHMLESGRRVPIHILNLAVRHGRRMADPQGAAGAFKYVSTMFRNGKAYQLEVVVREADYTVLHFKYW